jgi:hypothetical protein
MELAAPGVHEWLRGGWRGASGRGLPGTQGAPIPILGGMAVRYIITINWASFNSTNGLTTPRTDTHNRLGPISLTITDVGNGNQSYVWAGSSPWEGPLGYTFGNNGQTYVSHSYQRDDGLEDIPQGFAPGVIVRNQIEVNPVLTSTAYIPYPVVQQTTVYRTTEQLTRIIERQIETGVYQRPPAPVIVDIDVYLPAPPALKVDVDLTISTGVTVTAPKNRPERVQEGDECDTAAIKLERLLDDLSDKLDELKECACKEEEVGGGSPVQGIEWRYPVVRCVDGQVEIEQRLIYVAQLPPESYREEIRQMANASATVCVGVAPASVPDYWQVKAEAGRAQLVLTFRNAGTSDYLNICIPHPASDAPWTQDLFGDYWSGNFAGILKLKDNSSLVVNAESIGEANRVLDKMLSLVSPSMIPSDPERRVVERRGGTVKRAHRLLRKVSYFSRGQRDLRPDWARRVPSFNIL